MTTAIGNSAELHDTGETVGGLASVGSLSCVECGYALSLGALDRDLPRCPACGGSRFKRAAMFERPTVDADRGRPRHAGRRVAGRASRRRIAEPGRYLAFEDGGEAVLMHAQRGLDAHRALTRWPTSGSTTPPCRGATHSWCCTADGDLRALDDRSLNGLFVNGVRVDWTTLGDGDELEIGRYRLHVIDV